MNRIVHKIKRQVIFKETQDSSQQNFTTGTNQLPQAESQLSEDQLVRLTSAVKDWQVCNGSLLKLMLEEQFNTSHAYPIGVTLFPSPFPEPLFNHACQLQYIFNELYVAVSQDPGWLHTVLKDLIATDALTRTLWSVHKESAAVDSGTSTALGIFRSDYMLQDVPGTEVQLKQVEFNTVSCAGAVHGNRATDMHRFFQRAGLYDSLPTIYDHTRFTVPTSDNAKSLSTALAAAHQYYAEPKSNKATKTCVLFVVQPNNFNIADERPLEYQLWSLNPPIPTYRLEWGQDLLDHTTLTGDNCLLYHPPHIHEPVEVAVIYYRAGFEEHEYGNDGVGNKAKLRFEISRAIKCPSILAHLATFKKVQQALCLQGGVERFVSSEKARMLRETFMTMFPLDASDAGMKGRTIATTPSLADSYVLKPSREGGGNNVYREQISQYLENIVQSEWEEYVLMEMIEPLTSHNTLMNMHGIYQGLTVCELGIIGTCLWQTQPINNKERLLISNEQAGWSVRTKNVSVNEMSVVKGYGCFDSIVLT